MTTSAALSIGRNASDAPCSTASATFLPCLTCRLILVIMPRPFNPEIPDRAIKPTAAEIDNGKASQKIGRYREGVSRVCKYNYDGEKQYHVDNRASYIYNYQWISGLKIPAYSKSIASSVGMTEDA